MTAIDEITYRTPDALFNGSALVSVIQSCCPNIKNAWAAPSVDVTALLIAIRLASFGNDLEINSTCPSCQTPSDYTMTLQDAMAQLATPDFERPIKYGDLEIYFRPVMYQTQNQINIKQYEQQRAIVQVRSSDLPEEEQAKMLNTALQQITKLTVEVMAANIAAIRTPQALVSEPEFIREFVENCDRKLFTQIRDHAVTLREQSEIPPLSVKCSNCEYEYKQPIVLDATSFFETAS
jgi:rubredoxin